jgi:hypothetical protein
MTRRTSPVNHFMRRTSNVGNVNTPLYWKREWRNNEGITKLIRIRKDFLAIFGKLCLTTSTASYSRCRTSSTTINNTCGILILRGVSVLVLSFLLRCRQEDPLIFCSGYAGLVPLLSKNLPFCCMQAGTVSKARGIMRLGVMHSSSILVLNSNSIDVENGSLETPILCEHKQDDDNSGNAFKYYLGMISFDLDDTLFPTNEVVSAANIAQINAMNELFFEVRKPDDIADIRNNDNRNQQYSPSNSSYKRRKTFGMSIKVETCQYRIQV